MLQLGLQNSALNKLAAEEYKNKNFFKLWDTSLLIVIFTFIQYWEYFKSNNYSLFLLLQIY